MALLEHTLQKKLDRTDSVHTPCYCEENVYLLVKKLAETGRAAADYSDLFIVFVSNERKQVLMWRQQAGSEGDGACVWDYHVFLVQKRVESEGGSLIWDLDTTLPFPVRFSTYYDEAFRPSIRLYKEFERLFRVVPAQTYLQHFSSDRSHMRRPDGSWMAPPPPYPPILKVEGVGHALIDYVNVKLADCDGPKEEETEQKRVDVGPAKLQGQKIRTFGIVHTESTFVCCFL
ncbi:hypothetical protein KFL_000400060 [Klebsormidium nitens]|uniref:Protein N-terminal glutamine amidohydrolase n=1 Tax=Klebsormidium nitens TaxID=105231 RepID=A0A1Y1HP92_KLENI|nr:hypothetical protein KFL_000400060 [Klebsormidium nitens]|eukprot:GAQ79863.1 hypothetical protein KFL_000400060 [Klebsormidium nitens]